MICSFFTVVTPSGRYEAGQIVPSVNIFWSTIPTTLNLSSRSSGRKDGVIRWLSSSKIRSPNVKDNLCVLRLIVSLSGSKRLTMRGHYKEIPYVDGEASRAVNVHQRPAANRHSLSRTPYGQPAAATQNSKKAAARNPRKEGVIARRPIGTANSSCSPKHTTRSSPCQEGNFQNTEVVPENWTVS